MVVLKDRIREDMKDAMKKREEIRLRALKLLINAIKQFEVDQMKEASDENVYGIVAKEIKKRRESVEAYEKAGREDLAEEERKEIEVLTQYLPKQMSEEEIRAEAMKVIDQLGARSSKDLGKVMRELMPRLKGRAEGKTVNRIVMELLNN
ncbi:MAG: GatB/YqeY domain-containing protein [Thermotogae bacterium]|nr:GatB/YqeY domain-containing protein [Thermotogota bacterium]